MLHRALSDLKSLQKETDATEDDSSTDLLAEFLTPDHDAEGKEEDHQVEEASPTTSILQNKPKCQTDPPPAAMPRKPLVTDYGPLTAIAAAINAVDYASSPPPPRR